MYWTIFPLNLPLWNSNVTKWWPSNHTKVIKKNMHDVHKLYPQILKSAQFHTEYPPVQSPGHTTFTPLQRVSLLLVLDVNWKACWFVFKDGVFQIVATASEDRQHESSCPACLFVSELLCSKTTTMLIPTDDVWRSVCGKSESLPDLYIQHVSVHHQLASGFLGIWPMWSSNFH